jgi:hypothetical protein
MYSFYNRWIVEHHCLSIRVYIIILREIMWRLFVYIWRSRVQEGTVDVMFTSLDPPHYRACPKSEYGFQLTSVVNISALRSYKFVWRVICILVFGYIVCQAILTFLIWISLLIPFPIDELSNILCRPYFIVIQLWVGIIFMRFIPARYRG